MSMYNGAADACRGASETFQASGNPLHILPWAGRQWADWERGVFDAQDDWLSPSWFRVGAGGSPLGSGSGAEAFW